MKVGNNQLVGDSYFLRGVKQCALAAREILVATIAGTMLGTGFGAFLATRGRGESEGHFIRVEAANCMKLFSAIGAAGGAAYGVLTVTTRVIRAIWHLDTE